MNKRYIGLIALAIAGVIFLALNQLWQKGKASNILTEKSLGSEVEKSTVSNQPTTTSTTSYDNYDPSKLTLAENGVVVLFFHASWCPSCRALNADIEKNNSTIPSGVTILKVDYDTATELKKKYGVTYQHTLVQVNQNGDLLKKWSGSPTLSSLLLQIVEQ